ncbi:immunity 53 family protein [Micromonospora sp. NPDC051543]|uniref:immunity 53 family protein n=1 Tax=Micromonospora sp. NPDC051543 TaxID=3364287 RepID=UPI0037AB9C43
MHDHDELAPGVWSWLQAWYATQCDGEWEHEYGIRIETLDNPGWSVRIDLGDTALSGMAYERQEIRRSEHDWVLTWVEKDQFGAACGPLNLGEALHLFRQWVETATRVARPQAWQE